jgi:hypothetical protein
MVNPDGSFTFELEYDGETTRLADEDPVVTRSWSFPADPEDPAEQIADAINAVERVYSARRVMLTAGGAVLALGPFPAPERREPWEGGGNRALAEAHAAMHEALIADDARAYQGLSYARKRAEEKLGTVNSRTTSRAPPVAHAIPGSNNRKMRRASAKLRREGR